MWCYERVCAEWGQKGQCCSLYWEEQSLASERPGLGGVLVQFLPAWTSHLSFASDLRVENVMLALKDCGEDQDRVLDWSSQQAIRNGACYCLIKNACFFLIEV